MSLYIIHIAILTIIFILLLRHFQPVLHIFFSEKHCYESFQKREAIKNLSKTLKNL
jgi:hypothetical protein